MARARFACAVSCDGCRSATRATSCSPASIGEPCVSDALQRGALAGRQKPGAGTARPLRRCGSRARPTCPAAHARRYAAILDSTPLGIGDKDDIVRDAGFARAQAEDGQADEAAAVHNKPHARRCRVVRKVEVSVTSSDQSLTLETRESYSLGIDGGTVQIQANSVYGALRAFESLAQLVRRRTVERVERDAGGGAPLEGFVPPGAVWPGRPACTGRRCGVACTWCSRAVS